MQEEEIKVLADILEKGFHKEEGPFVKGLDRALASFNVQRQALCRDFRQQSRTSNPQGMYITFL